MNNSNISEKVKYSGELRIIGQIVNSLSDKEPLGYVIMTEKNRQIKAYTCEQTKWLINRFKFVNAEVDSNNKIINTECAMDRMPKFNTQLQILDTNKALILGKIYLNDKPVGFRILATNGKIVDLNINDTIELCNRGINIVNAKIVKTANKQPYIAGIKKEFDKIEKQTVDINSVKAPKTDRNKVKTDKIMQAAPSIVLNLMRPNRPVLYGQMNKLYINNRTLTKVDKLKIMEIISKELINVNGVSPETKKIALNIMHAYTDGHFKDAYYYYYMVHYYMENYNNKAKLPRQVVFNTEEDLAIALLMHLITDFNNEDFRKEYVDAIYKISDMHKHQIDLYLCSNNISNLIGLLNKYELANEKLLKLLNLTLDRINKTLVDTKPKNIIKNYNNIKMVNTSLGKNVIPLPNLEKEINEIPKIDKDFVKDEMIEYLGFSTETVSGRNPLHRRQQLRYLCDFIPKYDELMSQASCLGDLLLIAKVEDILKPTMNYPYTHSKYRIIANEPYNKYGYGECNHVLYNEQDTLALAELVLAVLAIYNPSMAKLYMEYLQDKVPGVTQMLPGVDLSINTDYGLSEEITTYYKSGMTVVQLFEHGSYINVRKNFKCRSRAKQSYIEQTPGWNKILNELGTVVKMITSSNCTDEIIDKYIININPF